MINIFCDVEHRKTVENIFSNIIEQNLAHLNIIEHNRNTMKRIMQCSLFNTVTRSPKLRLIPFNFHHLRVVKTEHFPSWHYHQITHQIYKKKKIAKKTDMKGCKMDFSSVRQCDDEATR